MTTTFPLALADFWDGLGQVSITFDLQDAYSMDGLRDGSNIWTDLGTPLWAGDVTVRTYYHADYEAVMAKVRLLREARASFWATPTHRPGALTTATIREMSDSRLLGLEDLGAGAVIPAGSFVSFDYGSSPTRYALHQYVYGVTANGIGEAALTEVVPAIRPGATVGATVQLGAPRCKAKIMPGMAAPVIRPAVTNEFSFRWVQSLK
jgi:hypothetical protein